MSSNAKNGKYEDRVNFPEVKNAANLLLSTIKTPIHFLEFLVNAAHWTAKIEDAKPREDAHFFNQVLTEDIAIPWLYSVTKQKPIFERDPIGKPLQTVMEGIVNVYDTFGHEFYQEQMAVMSEVFGTKFLKEIGSVDPNYLKSLTDGMNVIWLLWRPMHDLYYGFDLPNKE